MKEIEEEICQYKSKLQEFQSFKDEDLVFSMNSIENVVSKQISIIPKIKIPELRIKFSYDDNDLVKIDQFLNTMHQFSFDTFDPEEAKSLLNESFKIEKTWICHAWWHQNMTILDKKKIPDISKEALKDKMLELSWMRWKAFKPIELYPSFYYNKEGVSKEELDILTKRRVAERK